MRDQLITFETAELAYSKGFKWMTSDDKWYAITGELEISFQGYQENLNSYRLPVPTQSLLQRWLREEHRLVVCVDYRHTNTNIVEGINSVYYDVNIYKLSGGDAWKQLRLSEISDDYEAALERGLIEALKLIE